MAYTINSLLRPIVRWFRWFFDIRTPKLSVEFVPAITRYFLSDIVELRVKAKEEKPNTPREAIYQEVVKDFSARVEQAIRQGARNPKLTSLAQELLSGDLSFVKLDSAFTDATWRSPEHCFQSLCVPGTFQHDRISPADALIIVCLVLRAIQEVVLNVVRKDYPLQNPVLEVPVEMKDAMRKTFHRVDDAWREYSPLVKRQPIDTSLQPKSANTLETELRLLMARNTGSACLPLRPIPTSPLGNDDFSKPYAGVPSDEILRLSRQIRHADGSVLVSGYRGVGKSTFVNRIIYEALGAQEDFPDDQCLIVPVTVNLAKVSGVQNILRITLRTVRETLLEEDNREPRVIPTRRTGGNAEEDGVKPTGDIGERIWSKLAPTFADQPQNRVRLPLTDEEIDELNEAYLRAAYKVTMDASVVTEKSREYGGSLNLDPGKIFGGLASLNLGGLSAAIKRKRVEGLNRRVGYMDYDENAAEDDLRWLIGHLARFRPYRPNDSRKVRIKLVFVFDELDKMDVETGLKPMIEGLKNLFLQQSAVFFLVTSKKFYYDLLKDRAIEDAMLNSYFSAVVNVPLLRFSHAHEIVNKWVDRDASDELKRSSPNEEELVKRLARVLVYRSFGNPRDMIRELRRMQEWSDTQQPFLSDQGDAAKSFQIFAAIQNCVELTVGESTQSTTDAGTVTVVSDRLLGDEARLEQVRRGLYILIEELISRQRLVITRAATPTNGGTLPPPPGDKSEQLSGQMMSPSTISSLMEQWVNLNKPQPTSAALPVLEKIQQDNFSLVSLEDVQNLAKQLGGFLKNLHLSLDLPEGQRLPLFELRGGEELFVTDNFYALTGRTASAAATTASAPQKIDPKILAVEAKSRSESDNWQDKESAINLIKQLPTDQLSKELQEFLIETAQSAPDVNYRLMAAEGLNYKMLFGDKSRNISTLLTAEPDDRVLSVYLNLLGEAPDSESRLTATNAILDLLKADAAASRKLTETSAKTLFTVLPTVADEDVTDGVLNWLATASVSELALRTALEAFTKLAQTANLDPAEEIFGNRQILAAFLNDKRWVQFIQLQPSPKQSEFKKYLRELLRANPFKYSTTLLNVDADINVNDLLAYTWDLAFQPREDALANQIFEFLSLPQMKTRVMESIRLTPEFETRLLPYLQTELDQQKDKLGVDAAKYLLDCLMELRAKQAEQAAKADKPGSLADFIKKRTDYYDPLQGSYKTRTAPRFDVDSYVEDISVRRAIFCSIISLVAFALGMIVYRRDLPAAATFGTIIKSRTLLLMMDAAFFSVFFRSFRDSGVKTGYPSDVVSWPRVMVQLGAKAVSAGVIAYGAYYAHTRFIGPLNQRNQALQFLVNLPALAFFFYGFSPPINRFGSSRG